MERTVARDMSDFAAGSTSPTSALDRANRRLAEQHKWLKAATREKAALEAELSALRRRMAAAPPGGGGADGSARSSAAEPVEQITTSERAALETLRARERQLARDKAGLEDELTALRAREGVEQLVREKAEPSIEHSIEHSIEPFIEPSIEQLVREKAELEELLREALADHERQVLLVMATC